MMAVFSVNNLKLRRSNPSDGGCFFKPKKSEALSSAESTEAATRRGRLLSGHQREDTRCSCAGEKQPVHTGSKQRPC